MPIKGRAWDILIVLVATVAKNSFDTSNYYFRGFFIFYIHCVGMVGNYSERSEFFKGRNISCF
jgi:hypothetical protein